MSLTKVTTSMIQGAVISVLDVGIIPNDNTLRTENTTALLAALNTDGVYGLEFPPTDDTFYFDAFTLPQKPVFLTGHTTQRGNSGVILDIDAGGVGLICIDTPSGDPKTSRFSRIENLILSVPKTQTAIRVQNGGLFIDNLWITQCATGIHLLQSYGGSYKNIGISADYYGLRFGDGTNAVYNSINIFENLVINNYTNTNPGAPTLNASGICIDGTSGSMTSVQNSFINCDMSNCYEALLIRGNSIQNNFNGLWFEGNTIRNIGYNGVGTQNDCFINWYAGSPAAAYADVFVSTVTRLNAQSLTVKNTFVDTIKFPATQVPNFDPNTLDDYEEGTWTPIVTRDSSSPSVTYTSQTGTYVKIGRFVSIYGKIEINAISVNGAGSNIVQVLPYPPFGGTVQGLGVVSIDSALTTDVKAVQADGTNLYLVSTSGALVNENWVAGGTIEFSATYLSQH